MKYKTIYIHEPDYQLFARSRNLPDILDSLCR